MKLNVNPLILNVLKPVKCVTAFGLCVLLATGCGDSDKSFLERVDSAAEDAADAVEDAAEAAVNWVTGEKKTRAEIEKDLKKEIKEMNEEVSKLESKFLEDTVPEVQAANEERLEALTKSLAAAEKSMDDLVESSDEGWKKQRKEVKTSFEEARQQLDLEFERQEFTEDVNSKLNKLQQRMESVEAEAKEASGDAKEALEDQLDVLKLNYEELQDDFTTFQQAAKDEWKDFKEYFSSAFDDLAKAFQGLFD